MAQTTFKLPEFVTPWAKFIIAIVTIVLGVVAPYYTIKQDIALTQNDVAIIKENYLRHMEDLQRQMVEVQKEQVRQIEILNQLIQWR